jgi:hypothetical protein
MINWHKYLRDFLLESEVKFAQILNGEKISYTDFVMFKINLSKLRPTWTHRNVCNLIGVFKLNTLYLIVTKGTSLKLNIYFLETIKQRDRTHHNQYAIRILNLISRLRIY